MGRDFLLQTTLGAFKAKKLAGMSEQSPSLSNYGFTPILPMRKQGSLPTVRTSDWDTKAIPCI